MNKYVAFDIGGTFIKYGLIDHKAEILEHHKIRTPDTLEGMLQIIHNYAALQMDAAGIAVSIPGAVSEDGVIYGASAIPYIHGSNIKSMLQEKTPLPIFLENDANCAAIAELKAGMAADKQDAIVITIGTGIGGSVIKDRKLHKGANLHGGEFGFMLLSPNFDWDENGWVRMESTLAMVKRVAKVKQMEPADLAGEQVFDLAANGDKDCQQAIERFYHLLAIGIYNLQYMYDPEIILLSGGISARADLITAVQMRIKRIFAAFPNATILPKVDVCRFRQHANLLGAVYGLRDLLDYRKGGLL